MQLLSSQYASLVHTPLLMRTNMHMYAQYLHKHSNLWSTMCTLVTGQAVTILTVTSMTVSLPLLFHGVLLAAVHPHVLICTV
jgi:hypothetical protein